MTREQETLVNETLYLVGHIVGRMKCGLPRIIDRDDMRSAGNLGLVKAALKFDPKFGVPFGSYARTRIRGAILDYFRTQSFISRKARERGVVDPVFVSIQQPTGNGDTLISDGLYSDGPSPDELAAVDDMLDYAASRFTGRNRQIFQMLYGDRFTMKVTGALIGISESRVCQINGELIATLRNHIDSEALGAAS